MEQLTTSELSSVLEAWKNLDCISFSSFCELDVNFPNVLETYGKKGEEIIENQKSSLQGRKELAENTKGYQNEIDKLTKKLRFAENTYLNLYKIMSELPNPELYLAQQLEDRRKKTKENKKEETLKLDNKKLLQENKELKETIAQIRQEQENFLKDSQNTQQQQQGEYENQISYLKNRELSLQQQLTEAVHNLEHLRSTHDLTQSELLDITTNKDQEMLAKLAEFDVNQAELDRANLRINDLQLVVDIGLPKQGQDVGTAVK
ncbi:Protein CASP [Zancudomyces culisetae]|uniref:Protein CASP n=1 Tax=Zancudomyces culisetae TaxID=1213189 RepID=A0A1R1PM64_ZANCU|nr:Protein CASP [Zancudomyces culisetae]OMH82323.1 Protein CASP [Zancudomyces culisetae]|eukprot:OMH82019.1 Protein CASP [Zancudomyces culisetae]